MIEQQTINGRKATIAYIGENFVPATKADFKYAKVMFDDGELLFLLAPEPELPEPKTRRPTIVNAWAQAIHILDASELPLRDLIERDLQKIAGVSGTRYGVMLAAATQLMPKVSAVRSAAIKRALDPHNIMNPGKIVPLE